MKNTAIIIPTRLEARRFPNKPLAEINSKPMILHVLNRAKESKVGKVFVATPDKKIFDIVNNNGGIAILTQKSHPSGSDRIYEVYLKKNNLSFEKLFGMSEDKFMNLSKKFDNITFKVKYYNQKQLHQFILTSFTVFHAFSIFTKNNSQDEDLK